MLSKGARSLLMLFCLATGCEKAADRGRVVVQSPEVEPEIPLQIQERLMGDVIEMPFSDVIEQVTGKRILPLHRDDPVASSFLQILESAADRAIAIMNAPGSPAKSLRRINEASRLFEDALIEVIEASETFTAAVPETASGKSQRSGYPDIRIEHLQTGRVYYLDPKLYEVTAETSSLRTFYFTPKRKTSKVLDDACHLLLGIAHDGNDGDWQFLEWKLVDLSALTVRLKPEFQASNKDLYLESSIILSKKAPRRPDSP